MSDIGKLDWVIADLEAELRMLSPLSTSGGILEAGRGVARPAPSRGAMGGAGGPSQGGGGRVRAASVGRNASLAAPASSAAAASAAASSAPAASAASQSRGAPANVNLRRGSPEQLNYLARAAGFRSHNAFLKATIRPEPYRDPAFIRENVNNFRYLLVATHGVLIADHHKDIVPLTYTVPDNTILVKTGGKDACGKIVIATIFKKYLYHYFNPDVRDYTFCKFLGADTDYSMNSIFPTLQFLTPGETTYNKDLSLSTADFNNQILREIIGVSEVKYDTAGNLQPLETKMVDDIIQWKDKHSGVGLTEDQLVSAVNSAYPVGGSSGFVANVMILLSCSRGPEFAYAASVPYREATRETTYSGKNTGFAGCPGRPASLPPFPAECRKGVYKSTTGSMNYKRSIDEWTSRNVNAAPRSPSQSQNLREELEEEKSIAAVHKDMLITYIERTIILAQRARANPTVECDIGGSLQMIEGGRTEYENASQRIYNIAHSIKKAAADYAAHRTLAGSAAEMTALAALAASIDLDQYTEELNRAKAAVKFGRDRAIARNARGWSWLCAMPGRAMASLASYLPSLPWKKGGTRRHRRQAQKHRKTRRTK